MRHANYLALERGEKLAWLRKLAEGILLLRRNLLHISSGMESREPQEDARIVTASLLSNPEFRAILISADSLKLGRRVVKRGRLERGNAFYTKFCASRPILKLIERYKMSKKQRRNHHKYFQGVRSENGKPKKNLIRAKMRRWKNEDLA